MRFSQRIGKTPIKALLQVESIDESLNNRLWNLILEHFFYKFSDDDDDGQSDRELVCKIIWTEFYGQRIDLIPNSTYRDVSSYGVIDYIKDWYFVKALWYHKFDFVEFISKIKVPIVDNFIKLTNEALKTEISAYRLFAGQIVQITSEEEIISIEEALINSDHLKPVNEHLRKALEMLADKKTPNYRNSIKESISSIEAMCKIIVKDEKATLGKALAIIEKQYNLHSSLKEAYSKIYGYASDANGIRHAMIEGGLPVEFEDAKFMLVSCTAFINYLKAKLKM
ncbi:MAG: hypothetical protein JWR09_5188 [Mucilaginibacter sp.]|nr:hypothetical protein [Mucilaginibacter sp.]